ncbi:MAG TPA: GntR family transcriptional regulator, partial [Ruminococcaceae bacterium]|nr:GntR family transcriptional regulator [Oscillospiraceae bacterium]
MLLKIDMTSEVPIYRQIRDGVVLGVAGGRLSAGE